MNLQDLEDKFKPKHKIGHVVYYNHLSKRILCLIKTHCGSANNIPYYDLIDLDTQESYDRISEYDLTAYNSYTSTELRELAIRSLKNLHNENKETVDRSLMINSIDKTINHAQEEISELIEELSEAIRYLSKMIKNLNHYRRDRVNASLIKEEIFDNFIILTELFILFEDEPNKSFEDKLNKYKESINKQFNSFKSKKE